MNYIGSKNKLSSFIISNIKNVVSNLADKTFCEPFAGTGILSYLLKPQVKKIIANDLEYYSYVLNRNYLGNNQPFAYQELFQYLENNQPQYQRNFIFNEYSENGVANRLYFSEFNGKKIDQIRCNLAELYQCKEISEDQYFLR